MSQFSNAFFKYLEEVKRSMMLSPIILGGFSSPSGGSGGPPGGFTGFLPQTRIAYDTTEAEISGFVSENPYNPSGVLVSGSLLDNLNHIRYRLGVLEAGGAGIGDMLKSVYDINDDGTVNSADEAITIANIDTAGNSKYYGTNETGTPGFYDLPTISGNSTIYQALFSVEGTLQVEDNPLRIYNIAGVTRTIDKVFLAVSTPPSGASIIVDIHKNGTTIFTNQDNRPEILSSEYTGFTTVIDENSWLDGEYLTMHIDQVGTTVSGSDLTVHIRYS